MQDGQKVRLSLPCGSTLMAQHLGGHGVDVLNGTAGTLKAVLDSSERENTLGTVRFVGYPFDLILPTKYLEALS